MTSGQTRVGEGNPAPGDPRPPPPSGERSGCFSLGSAQRSVQVGDRGVGPWGSLCLYVSL